MQGAQLIGYQRSAGDVLMRARPQWGSHLYAVDAKNDGRRVIDTATRITRDWIVDENGEPKFRSSTGRITTG